MKFSTTTIALTTAFIATVQARNIISPESFVLNDVDFNGHLKSPPFAHKNSIQKRSPSGCSFWKDLTIFADSISRKAHEIIAQMASMYDPDVKQEENVEVPAIVSQQDHQDQIVLNEKGDKKEKVSKHEEEKEDDDSDSDSDSDDENETNDKELPQTGPTLLNTGINVIPDISLFASYFRKSDAFHERLNTKKKFTIIFAPINDAIEALKSKPWDFPLSVHSDDERKNEQHIQENIKTFLKAHVACGKKSDKGNADLIQFKNKATAVLVNADGKLQLHVVDLLGKTQVVNVIDQYKTHNGIIYKIDSSLLKP